MKNLIIKIMGTANSPINWFNLLILWGLQTSVFSQNVGIGTNTPLTRLHVVGGNDASLGGGGFLQIGLLSTFNLVIDDNEIMARINGSASTLSLNNDGGNIILGSAGGDNVGIGTNAPAERLHIAAGNIRLDNSLLGINLHGADRAMITRRFDVFTSGIHQGLGRWGLFLEPSRLTLGIPNIVGRAFAFSTYEANSAVNEVLTIDRIGQVKRPQSGNLDLLPKVMGLIGPEGNVIKGSGNFSVIKLISNIGTPLNNQDFWEYRITISPSLGIDTRQSMFIFEPDGCIYNVQSGAQSDIIDGQFWRVFIEKKGDNATCKFSFTLYN